ncbi:Uu.00g021460.m01.CDS01 [Anthostomella pinea]|uniref:Uu.00g021460.m01.CDS01 n=1 Tax=Anthostomella pinea TaxID=933095 RepID=A0AAI8YNR9_9PEZI|nr:Uu.00g021460.m01.CDS01 [Anthostomella pinea]
MTSSPAKGIEASAAAAEPTLPPVSTSTSSVLGVKRPAASLLPAFELSSSPGLPRPLKRQARDGSIGSSAYLKYPTPIPTSSTGILSSSPPLVQSSRPGLARTISSVSERAPLSAVPSVDLNENGEMLLMGRSSNSSHFQLTNNRLVSRIHVKAQYIPASSLLEPNKVEIICNGWNGLKLHCQGRTWELAKGDTFTSETENAEIMLDVLDARVMVHWPKRDRQESVANLSDSSWDESPRSRPRAAASDLLQFSPLRRQTRIKSPESPTPAKKTSSSSLDDLLSPNDTTESVPIYEDPSADEQELPQLAPDVDASFAQTEINNSFSSDLSEPDDDNDPDEENDPIVHSFGPFGANLSNRLAAFTAESPTRPSRVPSGDMTAMDSEESEESLNPSIDVAAVTNHLVNQLAFSRLSSTPLSAIMNNLPAEEKKDLTKPELRRIIESTTCIGTITRQGKDAAGKPLESEYYYTPELDTDDSRRIAVTDGLRKPSLRACRKQHKVLTRPQLTVSDPEILTTTSNIIGSGQRLLERFLGPERRGKLVWWLDPMVFLALP